LVYFILLTGSAVKCIYNSAITKRQKW